MYTDKSLVLCSPTGSGKTAVFEMAIVRLMTRSSSLNSSVKIVYSRLNYDISSRVWDGHCPSHDQIIFPQQQC